VCRGSGDGGGRGGDPTGTERGKRAKSLSSVLIN
jgi:hypothetical protein